MTQKFDVIIIGAGPIGLFLGLRLHQLGLTFKILEKNLVRDPHSRALGIHPPSMELLDILQVSEAILEQSHRIIVAHGYMQGKKIASLDLSICRKPYNFEITIPQFQTETILTDILMSRCPGCIEFNMHSVDFFESSECITVEYIAADNVTHEIQSAYLAGCDGKNSFVRNKLGLAFLGDLYSENYVMGDFEDFSSLNDDAAIFMGKNGVIESFPLPKKCRRWVVNVAQEIDEPSGETIAKLVFDRVGISIDDKNCSWATKFKTQGLIAEKLVLGRVLLCGDAACVVSPIGGQGMNLGWFNAWTAAEALLKAKQQPERAPEFFEQFTKIAVKKARKAMNRARFYRYLGSQTKFLFFKKIIAYLITHWPLKYLYANIITMRYF